MVGDFLITGHLKCHVEGARASDGRILEERRDEYAKASTRLMAEGDGESNWAP